MDERVEEVLQSIHGAIRSQNIRLTKEEMDRADQEILPFLEDFVVPNVEESKVKYTRNMAPIPRKTIFMAVLRYYAIIQNTVPVLNFLVEKEFSFEKFGKTIPLYMLDKSLASEFTEEEYLSILKKEHGSIKRFMDSLLGASLEERSKYIHDFADIVKKDPSLLAIGIGHIEDANNFNFLTRSNFDLYGKDYLLQMNHHQRIVVNSIYGRVEKEDAEKVKAIFEEYPDYRPTLPFYADLLKYFTVEELVRMKPKDEEMFLTAIRRRCVPKIKELLELDPSFECPDGFIREGILRSLDNETILGLTKEGMQELASITIPEVENVTVFPIKKINSVLFRDKIRKMHSRIKEKNSS